MNNFGEIQKKLDDLIHNKSPALIGLGNADRADDAFGLELVRRLKVNFPDCVFSESESSVEGIVYDFLESEKFDLIIFVDAVNFKGFQGELRIFDINDIDKFVSPISTHKVPMSLLMGLIQEHKKNSFLLGIQPGSVNFLKKMTPGVISSLDTTDTYFKNFFQS